MSKSKERKAEKTAPALRVRTDGPGFHLDAAVLRCEQVVGLDRVRSQLPVVNPGSQVLGVVTQRRVPRPHDAPGHATPAGSQHIAPTSPEQTLHSGRRGMLPLRAPSWSPSPRNARNTMRQHGDRVTTGLAEMMVLNRPWRSTHPRMCSSSSARTTAQRTTSPLHNADPPSFVDTFRSVRLLPGTSIPRCAIVLRQHSPTPPQDRAVDGSRRRCRVASSR